MAFDFRDLSMKLAWQFEGARKEPKAVLEVQNCGGQSFKLFAGTCRSETQFQCTTHPGDIDLERYEGPDTKEFHKLRDAMLAVIASLGSAVGTAERSLGTPEPEPEPEREARP